MRVNKRKSEVRWCNVLLSAYVCIWFHLFVIYSLVTMFLMMNKVVLILIFHPVALLLYIQ